MAAARSDVSRERMGFEDSTAATAYWPSETAPQRHIKSHAPLVRLVEPVGRAHPIPQRREEAEHQVEAHLGAGGRDRVAFAEGAAAAVVVLGRARVVEDVAQQAVEEDRIRRR